MENEQDWKFDKKKASKALQELSCNINPFRDKNVAELVRVITYCMDLEQSLDKACELLADGGVVIEDAASLKVKVVYKDIEGSGIEDGYEILSIRRV